MTLREGQTLRDLYDERVPLYEAEADIVFEGSGGDIEQTVAALTARLAGVCEARHGV